jgi:MFS family permease
MIRDRLYYGWTLVIVLALTETASWGVLYYSFTVFLTPMQTDLGASRAEVTLAFSLAVLVSAILAIPAGRLLDKYGPRGLMSLGSSAAALLVVAWAAVRTLPELYAVWLLVGVTMAAVLYEPAFAVVAVWFRRQRSKTLTVLTLIAGFASVIYIPLAGFLAATLGWRAALIVLAVTLAAITIPPHLLLLRRSPGDMGLQPDGDACPEPIRADISTHSVSTRTAVRGPTFWMLTAAFLFSSLAVGVIFVHIVPLLVGRGMSPASAAQAAGLIGLIALPGRLLLTPLGDRVPRGLVAAGIFLMQSLGLLALLVRSGSLGVVVFVVLFGMSFGAITPDRAALVAAYYGATSFGTISGILAFFVTGARGIAPLAAALLYEWAGTYRPVLLCLAVASLLAAALVVLADHWAPALTAGLRPDAAR